MKLIITTSVVCLALTGCQTTQNIKTQPENQQSSDVTKKTDSPSVPIHQAAYKGDVETIKQHLNSGTSVNKSNQYGATPLHYAARAGKDKVVALLVKYKANVNLKDSKEITPLHSASSGGHAKAVSVLIENGADWNITCGERKDCLLYTSPSPRDRTRSRMPSSA